VNAASAPEIRLQRSLRGIGNNAQLGSLCSPSATSSGRLGPQAGD
jgi:hypothetical protein